MTREQNKGIVSTHRTRLVHAAVILTVWCALASNGVGSGDELADGNSGMNSVEKAAPGTSTPAQGGTVKVTPLGSNAGDSCRDDRALLFEDPTGVRILYDPGRTVDGGTDARLGDVHVILLSHVHVDHLGDRLHANADGCGGNATGALFPQGNLAAIAAAKNSAVLVAGELSDFLARKIQNVLAVTTATAGCPAAGLTNELTAPRTSACTATLRPGGSRTVRMSAASAGVKIATVPAFHSNGIPSALVDTPGVAPGTTSYGGSEAGYVLRFTNGLTVYLSGDTGMFGDMDTIIRRYYQPGLVVVNMSDTATLGADEAAFVVKELVKPRSVIPSHVNEQATQAGVVRAGTRTERFVQMLSGSGINVVLPLSGNTRQFDGMGLCTNCP